MKAAPAPENFSRSSVRLSGAALVLGLALRRVDSVFGLRACERMSVRGGRLARGGEMRALCARGRLTLAFLLHPRPRGMRAGTIRESILVRAGCQRPRARVRMKA